MRYVMRIDRYISLRDNILVEELYEGEIQLEKFRRIYASYIELTHKILCNNFFSSLAKR